MKKVKKHSRILPARLPQKHFRTELVKPYVIGGSILGFSFIFMGILLSLLSNTYGLYKSEVEGKNLAMQRLNYWQQVVEKHPHFPAAYYEAAVYSAQLEDRERAKELLERALLIDPNFFEAEALAKELSK